MWAKEDGGKISSLINGSSQSSLVSLVDVLRTT